MAAGGRNEEGGLSRWQQVRERKRMACLNCSRLKRLGWQQVGKRAVSMAAGGRKKEDGFSRLQVRWKTKVGCRKGSR